MYARRMCVSEISESVGLVPLLWQVHMAHGSARKLAPLINTALSLVPRVIQTCVCVCVPSDCNRKNVWCHTLCVFSCNLILFLYLHSFHTDQVLTPESFRLPGWASWNQQLPAKRRIHPHLCLCSISDWTVLISRLSLSGNHWSLYEHWAHLQM